MFILACREIHASFISEEKLSLEDKPFKLPGLDPENDDVVAVGEFFGQYQRKLVHLCMDAPPYFD